MTLSLVNGRRWLLAVATVAAGTLLFTQVQGSDHGDTVENVQRPGADLTDVYIFPSPENSDNVVLVMNVHGLIPPGQAGGVSFDPGVLYQFKIDTNGDAVEDRVIQAKFGEAGSDQRVMIAGPVRPSRTGRRSIFEGSKESGTINEAFSAGSGMRVFAGARSDPFFLDLERFCEILPDRCVPFMDIEPPADPTQAQATSWRPPGEARDFLEDLNVLSIVVELPKASLGGGKIGVWTTTSVQQ